jgi:hypothetical protein
MARSDSAAAVRRGLFPEGERPVLVTRRHPGHIGKEGVTETSVSVQRPSAASLVGIETFSSGFQSSPALVREGGSRENTCNAELPSAMSHLAFGK